MYDVVDKQLYAAVSKDNHRCRCGGHQNLPKRDFIDFFTRFTKSPSYDLKLGVSITEILETLPRSALHTYKQGKRPIQFTYLFYTIKKQKTKE